jgi:IclR family acetate operon transcriptional repressor
LATYADEDVNAIICRQGMPRLTEKSIVRPGELFRQLETIRRRVMLLTTRKRVSDCAVVRRWSTTIAVSRSRPFFGMTSRITDERLPVLGCIVRSVAAELTVVLGGVMPPIAETVR